MNWFRLKTCIKCQGDLAADEGDWICLQCGTYYYTGLYRFQSNVDDVPQASNSIAPEGPEQKAMPPSFAAPVCSLTDLVSAVAAAL